MKGEVSFGQGLLTLFQVGCCCCVPSQEPSIYCYCSEYLQHHWLLDSEMIVSIYQITSIIPPVHIHDFSSSESSGMCTYMDPGSLGRKKKSNKFVYFHFPLHCHIKIYVFLYSFFSTFYFL